MKFNVERHNCHEAHATAGKTMNKKIMVAVEQAFIQRFGPWAGWAHNTLFISELASQRDRLPAHLQPGAKNKPKPAPKAPQLDPPAGIDEQTALEVRGLDSIVAESMSSKKRRLGRRSPKTATGKARDPALAAENSVKDEDGVAAKDLTSHGTGYGPSEGKVLQRDRRTKSKLRATRSNAAPSGKKTSGCVDTTAAAAAAVDQAVEDGAKATQVLIKRKR